MPWEYYTLMTIRVLWKLRTPPPLSLAPTVAAAALLALKDKRIVMLMGSVCQISPAPMQQALITAGRIQATYMNNRPHP